MQSWCGDMSELRRHASVATPEPLLCICRFRFNSALQESASTPETHESARHMQGARQDVASNNWAPSHVSMPEINLCLFLACRPLGLLFSGAEKWFDH